MGTGQLLVITEMFIGAVQFVEILTEDISKFYRVLYHPILASLN